MVLGLPLGTSDCSKCSSSSIRQLQKVSVNTGNEKTFDAAEIVYSVDLKHEHEVVLSQQDMVGHMSTTHTRYNI